MQFTELNSKTISQIQFGKQYLLKTNYRGLTYYQVGEIEKIDSNGYHFNILADSDRKIGVSFNMGQPQAIDYEALINSSEREVHLELIQGFILIEETEPVKRGPRKKEVKKETTPIDTVEATFGDSNMM